MPRLEKRRDGSIVVYTDGACSNNGYGNAKAGIGVFWSDNHPDNVSRPLEYGKQTNQRAELQAAIDAMEIAVSKGYRKLAIQTDSQYVISGVTEWVHNWQRNGWLNVNNRPVANQRDWRSLLDLEDQLDSVTWEHVPGHSDNYGNRQADRLARLATQ